jgi:hypothetical protein
MYTVRDLNINIVQGSSVHWQYINNNIGIEEF